MDKKFLKYIGHDLYNVKKLKERKNRSKEKKYIIEGFRLVEEGFKAGADIECLVIEEGNEQKANEFLKANGLTPIDWQIENR